MRMHLWCSKTCEPPVQANNKQQWLQVLCAQRCMLCSGYLTCSESDLPKARAAVLNVQGAIWQSYALWRGARASGPQGKASFCSSP